MSKLGKLRASEQRKAAKRARKDSRRRFWENLMAQGLNRKVKNYELEKMHGHDHPRGPCGNIGCKKCNPQEYNLLTPRLLHAKNKQS